MMTRDLVTLALMLAVFIGGALLGQIAWQILTKRWPRP